MTPRLLSIGWSKKDLLFFAVSTAFFALSIPASIVAAALAVVFYLEPTTGEIPLSFTVLLTAMTVYVVSCPAALLWGSIVPWVFSKPGSEIRAKHHLLIVVMYCAPFFLTLAAVALRFLAK